MKMKRVAVGFCVVFVLLTAVSAYGQSIYVGPEKQIIPKILKIC